MMIYQSHSVLVVHFKFVRENPNGKKDVTCLLNFSGRMIAILTLSSRKQHLRRCHVYGLDAHVFPTHQSHLAFP